jgi:hypothetical protein
METLFIRLELQRTHLEIALPLEKEREGNLELEDEVSYDKSNSVAREVEVTAGGSRLAAACSSFSPDGLIFVCEGD